MTVTEKMQRLDEIKELVLAYYDILNTLGIA